MKVICILQNAWGDRLLPPIFVPNLRNKSAKTIRKMIPDDMRFHFCNTTPVVTPTAKGKPDIDAGYFKSIIKRFAGYNLILVCGKQAEEAVSIYNKEILSLNIPVLYIPHPACRTLSHVQINEIRGKVNSYVR